MRTRVLPTVERRRWLRGWFGGWTRRRVRLAVTLLGLDVTLWIVVALVLLSYEPTAIVPPTSVEVSRDPETGLSDVPTDPFVPQPIQPPRQPVETEHEGDDGDDGVDRTPSDPSERPSDETTPGPREDPTPTEPTTEPTTIPEPTPGPPTLTPVSPPRASGSANRDQRGVAMTEFHLDEIEADLAEASGVIDNPDAPYNWAALSAMRTAEKLLAEVRRLRAALESRPELPDGRSAPAAADASGASTWTALPATDDDHA